MKTFVEAFFLSIITIAIAPVAYEINLTENLGSIGGYLPFVFFTFSPLVFFTLGRAFGVIEAEEKGGATYRKPAKIKLDFVPKSKRLVNSLIVSH